MIEREAVTQIIFNAIDEINEQRSDDKKLEKSLDIAIYGQSGALDSLSLVNFIVSIEDKLIETFDVTLTLADEKAMSQKNSPFSTISNLVEYIIERLTSEAAE